MKILILALIAVPILAAAPVNFGTFLLADGTQSQFSSPSDTRNIAPGQYTLTSIADLSTGTLHTLNARSSGAGGLATQALLYDTITFAPSAFQGTFGASYNLNLTATYEGTYSHSGVIDSAGLGGRIHVYSGDTVIDSGVFADSTSLINFMFIGGPTPLCANGVNGPDLTSYSGTFSFSVSCLVTVTAANPTVRLLMNLPTFINAGAATWNLDMLNTATLDLGDLAGRTVFSASGVLPQTEGAVPEPGSAVLLAIGLVLGALLRCVRANGKRGQYHGAAGSVACR